MNPTEKKSIPSWPAALLAVIVTIVLAGLLIVFPIIKPPTSLTPDNRQILYWYAAQLRAENGLVFNPGERVLLIAAPAYMLLLALFGSLFSPSGIARSADWLFIAAQAVGVYSLFRIVWRAGLSDVAAVVVALLYAVAWPLWLGIGTAAPMMVALALLALDIALGSRWIPAGIVLAAAILCSPETIFLALPLLLIAITEGTGRRFTLALLIPLVLAGVGLRLYYGPSLWDGLLILKPSAAYLDNSLPWLLSLPILGVAAYGWLRRHTVSMAIVVLGAWAVLHLLIDGVLLRMQAAWQYAPVVAPALVLAGVGLQSLSLTVRRAGYVLLAALVLASTAGIDGPPPLSSAQPLPEDMHSIGVMSTARGLTLRYSPDQVIIAFDGQLQLELKQMIERGDIQSTLIRYAPDLLITTDSARIPAKSLSTGGWAYLDYRPIDRPGMYIRYTEVGHFADQPANVPYGLDVRLVGLALDQASLRPGQLLRVRLDWDLARPASKPITIDLRLESGEFVLAHSHDEYAPSIFEAGRWSTYHTLLLSNEAWPGPVTLNVGVIVSDGTIARAPVATLNVTTR